MIIIPGIVISILTFPGVIIHEVAHMLFCKIRKVPIFDVKFFQFNLNTCGYVLHAEPEDFTSTFLISIGPFILNSLLCIVICFPASIPIFLFDDMNFISLFLIWLGISMGINAFPSKQDAKIIWDRALKEVRKKNILAIISFPIVILIYIFNLLKFFWFDALYGIFIGIVLPGIIFKKLM